MNNIATNNRHDYDDDDVVVVSVSPPSQEVKEVWRIFPVPPRRRRSSVLSTFTLVNKNDTHGDVEGVDIDSNHEAGVVPASGISSVPSQQQQQQHIYNSHTKPPPTRGRKWQTNSWHEYIVGDEVLIVDTKKMKKLTRKCKLRVQQQDFTTDDVDGGSVGGHGDDDDDDDDGSGGTQQQHHHQQQQQQSMLSTLNGTVVKVVDLEENDSRFLNTVPSFDMPDAACRRKLVYVKVHSLSGVSSSSSLTSETTLIPTIKSSDQHNSNGIHDNDDDDDDRKPNPNYFNAGKLEEGNDDDIVLMFDPRQQQTCLQPNFSYSLPSSLSSSVLMPSSHPIEQTNDESCTVGPAATTTTASTNSTTKVTTVTVVVARETPAFRQLTHQLHASDRVLEIGCSTGETSKRIVPIVQSWIGFDNSDQMLDRCTEQLEQQQQLLHVGSARRCHIKLVKVDALIEPKRAFYEATVPPFGYPTVIFLDIGGNREYKPVLQILSWVFEYFTTTPSSSTTTAASPIESNNVVTAQNAGGRTSPSSSSSLGGCNSGLRLIVIKSREIVHAIQNESCLDTRTNNNSSSPSSLSVRIDFRTGIVTNGPLWFKTACQQLLLQHQQQSTVAPSSTSSTTATTTNKSVSPLSVLVPQQNHPRYIFKHPLKAPLVLSPVDEKTPICRYHNYHREGCKLRRPPKPTLLASTTSDGCYKDDVHVHDDDNVNCSTDNPITYCPSDHEHCHACRQKGHVALNCTNPYSLY
jgi:hypothetical protein